MTYHDQMKERAKSNFADHELVATGPRQWMVRRPDSGFYATEIVAVANNTLIAHGDILMVAWQGHSSDEPEDLLRWVAGSHIGYLQAKITRAMGCEEIAWTYDKGEAFRMLDEEIAELEVRAAEYEDDYDDDLKYMREARERLDGLYDIDEVREFMIDNITDAWEWVHQIGRVPHPRVYHAHAAVRKAVELIDGA